MHGAAPPHQLARNHRLRLMRCHVGGNGLGFGGDFEMSDKQLPKALQLAELMQAAVQTYPQQSEDEPGGYCTQVDQLLDEAAAELIRLDAREDELLHHVCVLQGMNDESLESIRALTAELEQARAALAAQGEPFGYFRAEPFGWTDCAKDDEGAIALYTALPAPAKPMTDTWADGVQAAADLLKRMADEMAMERGETDPATGAIQFKSAATREWHASLGELAEEIERLKPTHPAPAAQNEREANATARAFSLATMAAEEFVRCNGLSTGEPDEFLMTGGDLTDEYATECIEHLKHVGECVAFDCDDGVIVRLGDFTIGSLS